MTTYRLRRAKKRGIFIDCGSNLGQGFDFFRRFYVPQYFDYVLFEPNPNCIEFLCKKINMLKGVNAVLYPKAVALRNDRVKFYGVSKEGAGKFSEGGSVLLEHNSAYSKIVEEESLEVETINFIDFLREKIAHYETIVIKMDIEGGEYEIISKLLEEELFDHIESLYIEFHSRYMSKELKKEFRSKERYFLKQISKTSCSLCLWV